MSTELSYVQQLCDRTTPPVGLALARRALPHAEPASIVSGEVLFDEVPDLVTLKVTTSTGGAAPKIPAEWVEQELRAAGIALPEKPQPAERAPGGCCSHPSPEASP